MANRSAILTIKILSDASKAGAGIEQATGKVGKFQSGLKKAAIPAAIVGAAVVKFGVDSVNAARDAEVAQKRLQAIFKSMGDTTGESAKQADKYASALSRQIGVDDEVIKAGQAKLATFSKVSSKASMMNGVFDRATGAGADLAAAGFGSIESNAVLLGKALQDPIKGVSALARVGVTLTDQQKKQAEAMAKAGDTAGAQKIILGAVEKQVKGTAAATATSGDKMKVAMGEFQEKIGAALLPVIDKVVPKLSGLFDLMAKHSTTVMIVVGVIGALAGAILALNVVVGIYTAVTTLAGSATLAAWIAALWPILAVIAAVALVAVGFVILYKKSKVFRDFVNALWAGLKAAAVATANVVKAVWRVVWAAASAYVKTYLAVVKVVFNAVRSAVGFVVDKVRSLGQWLGRLKVPGVVKTVLDTIRSVTEKVISKVKDLVSKLGNIKIPGAVTTAANALKSAVEHTVSAVQDLVSWLGRLKVPHLSFPKIPKIFSKLLIAPPVPAAAGPAGFRAAGMVSGRASTTSAPIVVNVNGALDPEGVARQIRRILNGHDQRVGLVRR